ncbi:MAG: hypothetical protein QXW33_05200 [Candidatus Bathyarchaeia archaeon]
MKRAEELLTEFKGDDCAFGAEALKKFDRYVNRIGRKTAIITSGTGIRAGIVDLVSASLRGKGYEVLGFWRALVKTRLKKTFIGSPISSLEWAVMVLSL